MSDMPNSAYSGTFITAGSSRSSGWSNSAMMDEAKSSAMNTSSSV